MAQLNPFEPKRKKARTGASSWVCNVQVAETKEFEDWAAGLDGVVEVGTRNGQSVFVRGIAGAP